MAVTSARLSVYIVHPQVSELTLTLFAGDGTNDDIFTGDGTGANLGSGPADAQRTEWKDDADYGIWHVPTAAPWVGAWRPSYHDFAVAFGGLDADGNTWTLKAVDSGSGNTGTIQAASLFLTSEGSETRYDALGLPIAIPDDDPDGVIIAFALPVPPEAPDPDTEPTTGGLGLLSAPSAPGYFRIELTSLHRGEPADHSRPQQPAATLARLEDFTRASVTIPINDQREATVTISMDDPACAVVKPYETLLHIVYVTPNASYLAFWGIVTKPVWNSADETLTIPAVDMSLKLQWRQVRFGTRILASSEDPDTPNPFNSSGARRSTGFIPLDYVGLGWIRDAARNNGPTNARGVPPLGITDGINTASPLPLDTQYKIEARRGDTLWDLWQQVVGYQVAPDFELEPRDGTFGVYARLNTYTRQGHADATRIVFHDGFGLDNCLIDYEPGGTLVTDIHVLSTGDQSRITINDQDAEEQYGIYVTWTSTDYPAKELEALADFGQQTMNAYSTPPDYFTVTPNLDCGLYYLDDFAVGDALTAVVRRGQLKRVATGDIRSVKLNQADDAGNVSYELDVAVSVSRTTIAGGDI